MKSSLLTKQNALNFIKRPFICLFLLLHASTTLHWLHEIILLDGENYEILFYKIQYCLTAIVSLVSLVFYIYHSGAIKSTSSKLQHIDESFNLIKGYKPYVQHSEYKSRTFLQPCVYFISIVIHFHVRCLRGYYFHDRLNSVILRCAFMRTYFTAVNGFVAIKFTNHIADGKNRFILLNRHFNNQMDIGRSVNHAKEVDAINRIYFQMVDYCNEMRKYYQPSLFVILVSDMFTVVYMIVTGFHEFVSKSVPLRIVLYCIVDAFVRILQTVFVTSTAQAVTFQTHRWADTLQRIIIETQINPDVKEKLKLFLLEMIDKKPIFLISGFVHLSHKSMIATAGTMCTYLLIMMQFQPVGFKDEEDKMKADFNLF